MSNPKLEGYGNYIVGKMVTIWTGEDGDVVGFRPASVGKYAAEKILDEFGELSELSVLLLVPDCVTVEMPWDNSEHIFHVSQVYAVTEVPT